MFPVDYLFSCISGRANRMIRSFRLPLPRIARRSIYESPLRIAQQARRPLSPHLTIYQPQLTWLMSIGHRMTGAFTAALLYSTAMYYGVAQPADFAGQLALGVQQLPLALVSLGKFAIALPFYYHSLNGIRHLIWDVGLALSLRGVYAGGWLVNSASLTAALYSALIQ